MRKCRTVGTGRCYHLISRLAHRAFFLDDDEKTRAVDLMRRVEEFSGILILAYAFMSNHFHIFIYVPEVEELGEDEILRRINTLYRGSSLAVVLGERNRLRNRLKEEEAHEVSIRAALDEVAAADAADGKGAVVASASMSKKVSGLELPRARMVSLEKGDAAVAERILELLSGGPMKPAALRAAIGIRRRDHFNEYYIAPMLEKGHIERADPDYPQSPQQMYRRVK